MWLEFYQRLIEQAAPFPPDLTMLDGPAVMRPVPAEVPDRIAVTYDARVVVTGYDPGERRATLVSSTTAGPGRATES
jgi:hypothetical protein